MSTSILYCPASDDPHGILADGLCGAKVPTVVGIRTGIMAGTWKEGPISWKGLANPVALPLVWYGEVVPEAEDRLTRVLGAKIGLIQVVDHAAILRTADESIRSYGHALATIAARVLGGRVELVNG